MSANGVQRLHWQQRIALVRHNLHSARRTGDFSFFKSLQAHALIDSTDHVALLYATLGDNADSVLSTLDNLNAGIAYVHQDAFKAVYDSAKASMHNDDSLSSRRSLLRVDISQQRDMADHAIDKTTNSAINLIQVQPVNCQDAVANAWITGTTIIADAVCVCLNEMDKLEHTFDDFILLEYSWSSIQSSVDACISALRGIFSLMALPNVSNVVAPSQGRNLSISSIGSDHPGAASNRSRSSSTASAFSFIKRALTNTNNPAARTGSLALSVSPPEANPRGFRASMSAAVPTRMSTYGNHPHTVLSTIPSTPAVMDVDQSHQDDLLGPFKQNGDYFAFDMGKASDKDDTKSSSSDDLMQLESLDPLYSPSVQEPIKMPIPLTLRRASSSFGMVPNAAIAVP